MPTPYEKLSTLLKELFQLDQADLDFGIYRIMNQKRGEITLFLDHDLLPQVKAAFDQYRPADRKVIEGEIQKAVQGAEALGMDPNDVPKVKELREQLANYSVDTGALENEVYSHLYSFFRRYYDNGDFISMRRYKEGVYAIPYEGEEVKLHWANADQYYVKTTENFRDYTFRLPSERLAHFKIVEAESEKDNVKAPEEKDRRFILASDDAVTVEDGALVMRFEYRIDGEKRSQKELNTLNAQAVLDAAPTDWQADLRTSAPSESSPTRTLLDKHLADYSARNTFDYFIHKDLRGFLNRELDFYIKNEIMRLDDIENTDAPRVEQYLSKIKVVRTIAHRIIDFLAQIEDFQKKLWLKKKFVVETNYCITLDRVPEELYPEICSNDAQREEWVKLFAIDEITGKQPTQPELGITHKPIYSEPLTVEFLKANHYLVLDTRYFDKSFVNKYFSSIEIIEDQIDGYLIQAENFQAISMLTNTFENMITSIYIDPPYNSDASSIIYKNNYKDSSWLSLLESRLTLSHPLLKSHGVICVAIDDEEVSGLRYVLSNIYQKQIGIVTVRSNPAGRKTKGKFAPAHEYALFFGKSDKSIPHGLQKTDKSLARFPKVDEKGRFAWANFIRSGNNDKRKDRPKLFYPIFVHENNSIRIPKMEWSTEKGEYVLLEKPQPNETVVLPVINSNGNMVEKNWQRGHERVPNELEEYRVRRGKDGSISVDFKTRMDEESLPITWWDDKRYASANYGAAELKELFGEKNFDYPKSRQLVLDCLKVSGIDIETSIVLDFFAGSGTTGHAVINLNREEGGNRKYVLVEMGEYFNTVLKPRILKVIYSKDWSEGKPVSREGSSHCFKYLRLESYEDTLNNLALKRSENQQLALEAASEFKENYMLSYMLDVESKDSLLNIQSFVHPFDYQLNIATGMVGESKPTKIDLVETFNYLIGLHVETIQVIRGFHVVTGENPAGERTLVIWRDLADKSNADLEEFFRKQDYNPRDMEFDLIYVNGDNNLENLRRPDETWKVRLIEEEFLKLMFETEE